MNVKMGLVLEAWGASTKVVANAPAEFDGRHKEKKVLRQLRQEIERLDPALKVIGPDNQERFDNRSIDLVCIADGRRVIAVESKYKTVRDSGLPDNRKAAFFDLYKLEQYVASGRYLAGAFLWLTDEPRYLKPASGDSADFSTHEGRTYRADTPLRAARARNKMPLPLRLTRDFSFRWEPVEIARGWFRLAILVVPSGSSTLLTGTSR